MKSEVRPKSFLIYVLKYVIEILKNREESLAVLKTLFFKIQTDFCPVQMDKKSVKYQSTNKKELT